MASSFFKVLDEVSTKVDWRIPLKENKKEVTSKSPRSKRRFKEPVLVDLKADIIVVKAFASSKSSLSQEFRVEEVSTKEANGTADDDGHKKMVWVIASVKLKKRASKRGISSVRGGRGRDQVEHKGGIFGIDTIVDDGPRDGF
jgi:hypothetical protein